MGRDLAKLPRCQGNHFFLKNEQLPPVELGYGQIRTLGFRILAYVARLMGEEPKSELTTTPVRTPISVAQFSTHVACSSKIPCSPSRPHRQACARIYFRREPFDGCIPCDPIQFISLCYVASLPLDCPSLLFRRILRKFAQRTFVPSKRTYVTRSLRDRVLAVTALLRNNRALIASFQC